MCDLDRICDKFSNGSLACLCQIPTNFLIEKHHSPSQMSGAQSTALYFEP